MQRVGSVVSAFIRLLKVLELEQPVCIIDREDIKFCSYTYTSQLAIQPPFINNPFLAENKIILKTPHILKTLHFGMRFLYLIKLN